MSTQAMSYSGVTPSEAPALDHGASAFYDDPVVPQSPPSRGPRPVHTAIRLSSCIFSHGEGGWRGGN